MHDRTAIFIDGAYLDKLLEYHFDRARIDFGLLSSALAPDDNIFRTYYYHCPPYCSNEPSPEEIHRREGKERFFNALSSLPRFQLRLGTLVYRGQNSSGRMIFVQKLVDVMLGVDLVLLAATHQITRAILITGDSDYMPAVEAAKNQGVLISLWHGPHQSEHGGTIHRELWEICDERFEIKKPLIEKVLRQPYNDSF